MGRRLRLLGSWALVSVLDLEERVETAADGTVFRYAVDPSTGLAMAPDQVHVPCGVVVDLGPDVMPPCSIGEKVILQRDLGRQFEWDGMMVQPVQTAQVCPDCGKRSVSLSIAAMQVHGQWLAGARRMLLRRVEAPGRHQLDVLGAAGGGDVKWGEVCGVGRMPLACMGDLYQVGALAVYRDCEGLTEWTDAGTSYASVPLVRSCRCGRTLSEGGVLAIIPRERE